MYFHLALDAQYSLSKKKHFSSDEFAVTEFPRFYIK